MSGFDMEWAAKQQRKTGREVKVQAGAGSGTRAVDPIDAAYARAEQVTLDQQADPFAPAPAALDGVLRLTLPYPISANRYWRTRVVTPKDGEAFASIYVSTEAKEFKADVQRAALVAGIRKPLLGRVAIAYTLFPNRPQDWARRARKDPNGWADTVQCLDLDNCNKVLLDALKGIAFEDDKWVHEIHARRADPDGEGRLEVVIMPATCDSPQLDLIG